jgi:CRISPR type III-B/RAMP module-associated protein Cmr5
MDNGLLQTLAFYRHKRKVHGLVATHLEEWLEERGLLAGGDPLVALSKLDASSYRRCSEEAIAWLNLAKRLAAARVAMRGNR